MRRMERIPDSVFSLENSSVDTNRFYSILLDANAATVSENMCDITEKLLHGEKENAKAALDQLWSLKKNLLTDTTSTLDMVISFYQDKIDILRHKEEHIKKISKDSRTLLEEKRKRDEEVTSIKQQITDCTKEITELSAKLEKLKVKEQELMLIDEQLKKELNKNEHEIVNGLYEIILSQQEKENELRSIRQQKDAQLVNDKLKPAPVINSDDELQKELIVPAAVEQIPVQQSTYQDVICEPEPPLPANQQNTAPVNNQIVQDIPPFPKSVVKTTQGRVIGEYYYDGRVYKNERHYIFNSRFFSERLSGDVKFLRQKFDQTVYSEVMQMIHQAYTRVSESKMFHFEVSTNEILNEKTLKQLWQFAKIRNMDEVERFCLRLKAKIDALGTNYRAMLQEQMNRCSV